MKNSIIEELESHINDLIENGVLTLENVDDWHFHAFNEDHYLIGYYNCEQWLKKHDVSPFEAIETIREYEMLNFGRCDTDFSSSENVVNMYVYIMGEQLLSDIQGDLVESLENNL